LIAFFGGAENNTSARLVSRGKARPERLKARRFMHIEGWTAFLEMRYVILSINDLE
jgi:hypothetical protein